MFSHPALYARLVSAVLASVALFTGGCSALGKGGPGVTESRVRIPGKALQLDGVLFVPPAAAASRRPAIVMMHGCGGLNDAKGFMTARHRDWAERMAADGYVVLHVDSFRARDSGPICELADKDRPAHPWRDRVGDAYAALDWLVARKDVDPKRVFVLGWSHGGSTVTGVARAEAIKDRAGQAAFRAAVAFYPGCARPLAQKSYSVTMPLIILHGAADDWTPAQPCIDLAARLANGIHPVRTVVYPGAHHGFDVPGNWVTFHRNVYNPRMPGERGAHVGGHEPSRLKAIEEVQRFLRANS